MDETFKTTPSASSPVPAVPGAWPELTPLTHMGSGVPMEASSRGSRTHTCMGIWCIACGKLSHGSWYICDKCDWNVLVRISFPLRRLHLLIYPSVVHRLFRRTGV